MPIYLLRLLGSEINCQLITLEAVLLMGKIATEWIKLVDPGFISGNYPHSLPSLPKLLKKVWLFGSLVVLAALLEPTVPTEILLKPQFSVRIENDHPCAIPTSSAQKRSFLDFLCVALEKHPLAQMSYITMSPPPQHISRIEKKLSIILNIQASRCHTTYSNAESKDLL
nr:hypothetical protein HmN_000155900 [Hymenolepis microstoma]